SNPAYFEMTVPTASPGWMAWSGISALNAGISVMTADFNGDGKLDAAEVSYSESLSVFLGNGDGTFNSPIAYAAGNVGGVVADFNNDGIPDLATTDCGSAGCQYFGDFQILLGNGDGTFRSLPSVSLGFVPGVPIAGDFDRDGKLDLAV